MIDRTTIRVTRLLTLHLWMLGRVWRWRLTFGDVRIRGGFGTRSLRRCLIATGAAYGERGELTVERFLLDLADVL